MRDALPCPSALSWMCVWGLAFTHAHPPLQLIFDAVLKIMYAAVVPWSAAVEQLVKQHLEMAHPK